MKKLNMIIIFILLVYLLLFVGCSGVVSDHKSGTSAMVSESKKNETTIDYIRISAEEAKKLMDESENYIILDVRTEQEFKDGHIEGAILLPSNEILTKAEELLPDKNQLILIYCRSGNRSATATLNLIKLGYTNAIDFGGILDWTYGTVK